MLEVDLYLKNNTKIGLYKNKLYNDPVYNNNLITQLLKSINELLASKLISQSDVK